MTLPETEDEINKRILKANGRDHGIISGGAVAEAKKYIPKMNHEGDSYTFVINTPSKFSVTVYCKSENEARILGINLNQILNIGKEAKLID